MTFPFSGWCWVCHVGFDTLGEWEDHELRHKGEADRRRRVANEATWAISHRNARRAREAS